MKEMTCTEEFVDFHKEWEPKIRTMASRTFINDTAIDNEDVFQELSYTLWKCFNSYDPKMGIQFNTYFYTSAKNQVYMMLQYAGAKKRSGVKVNLDMYNGFYYDNRINQAVLKVALFQTIKDRQTRAAIEYILEGGDPKDLPMDVVKRLKKALGRTLKHR